MRPREIGSEYRENRALCDAKVVAVIIRDGANGGLSGGWQRCKRGGHQKFDPHGSSLLPTSLLPTSLLTNGVVLLPQRFLGQVSRHNGSCSMTVEAGVESDGRPGLPQLGTIESAPVQ
jgi:hypothetical protein